MSFSKAFEKDKAKRYDEFEEMSQSPKYKKINDFNKRHQILKRSPKKNWLHCQNGWALKMILTKQ